MTAATLPAKVAVLGAGSWGTTFAKIAADSGAVRNAEVLIWARRSDAADEINESRRNTRYLKDTVLPANLRASADAAEVLSGAQLVVLAVPAQTLRARLQEYTDLLPKDADMKGVEVGSDARMSQVIAEELDWPQERIAVLSGPNLAMEIAREEPTASVVACSDLAVAGWIAEACTAPYFRPYTNTDVIGTEIGGIVKNVIALAVGICEGKQMGDNTKASVMTRGLAETTRLAVALGGKTETLFGLSGMGDLIATCSSSLMPERITLQLSRFATQRIAQDATDQSGCTSLKTLTISSLRVARLPPLTGSITTTGMPLSVAS